MSKIIFRLAALAVFAAALCLAHSMGRLSAAVKAPPSAAEPAGMFPPAPPAHAKRKLDTPTALAKDLHEVVAYLEKGQKFFRDYQTGSHTVEENAAFLKFLERYEAELKIAKKESLALRKWVVERGSLDAALEQP